MELVSNPRSSTSGVFYAIGLSAKIELVLFSIIEKKPLDFKMQLCLTKFQVTQRFLALIEAASFPVRHSAQERYSVEQEIALKNNQSNKK